MIDNEHLSLESEKKLDYLTKNLSVNETDYKSKILEYIKFVNTVKIIKNQFLKAIPSMPEEIFEKILLAMNNGISERSAKKVTRMNTNEAKLFVDKLNSERDELRKVETFNQIK